MKTVVALGDLHCGHIAGLTPPDWQSSKGIGKSQKEAWKHYLGFINKYKSPDLLIVNGDALDGKGTRSGGTELITNDMFEQVEMAYEALKLWKAKKIVLTYGTAYHVSPDGEDFELSLSEKLGGEIHSHAFIDVDNITIDVKHHVGSSSIPWSRGTAVSRERIQNMLWAEQGQQPKSDIILRSHVHYYSQTNGYTNKYWSALTLPALQLAHTKYGARRCSGTINWGIMLIHVNKDDFWFIPDVINLKTTKKQSIKI